MVSLLAVVAIALGILYSDVLIIGAAGVLLLGVFGSMGSIFGKKDKKAAQAANKEEGEPPSREEELRSLGIMEIRPKESLPKEEAPPFMDDRATSGAQPQEQTVAKPRQESEGKKSPDASGESVLATCLTALQNVLDAHSVCLLKQEELALQYEIIEAVGEGTGETSFTTRDPLVTAGMTRRSVTVQRVGSQALPAYNLGYYEGEAPVIRQVMMAPVRYPREPVTCFLLADTERAGGFNGQRPRDLISQFASLIGGLLEDEAERADLPSEDVRPRREIIQEAITGARDEGTQLTLVLVYLNRAEALAGDGEAAVTEAEKALEERLARDVPRERVVRFGELTYGIFHMGEMHMLEAWASAVQRELSGASGRLEGGVSIGMATLGDDNSDPEKLRADATRALREAYETGALVLLD